MMRELKTRGEERRRKVREILEAKKDLRSVVKRGVEKAEKHDLTVRRQFMKRRETFGIGEGDQELFVLVDRKVKEPDIPTEIDGVPVRVERTSPFVCLPLLKENTGRKKTWRPIPGGVAGAHCGLGGYGTIGGVVYKQGKLHVLSNNHVFALSNRAKIGDRVSQPYGMKHDFGRLVDFVEVKTGATVDCAIAIPDLDSDVAQLIIKSDEEYEPYVYTTGTMRPKIRQKVIKSGARSGFTEGTIKSVNTSVSISYPGAQFTLEEIIMTSVIGWPGDSGSFLLDKSTNKAVGLLFCGSDVLTGHCDMTNVLNQLKCDMPTERGEVPRIGYLNIAGSPDKADIWVSEQK